MGVSERDGQEMLALHEHGTQFKDLQDQRISYAVGTERVSGKP